MFVAGLPTMPSGSWTFPNSETLVTSVKFPNVPEAEHAFTVYRIEEWLGRASLGFVNIQQCSQTKKCRIKQWISHCNLQVLTLWRPAAFRDLRKNSETHVALCGNFSRPVSATNPVKSLKDTASLVACTPKKFFCLGCTDCFWVTS